MLGGSVRGSGDIILQRAEVGEDLGNASVYGIRLLFT